MREQRRVSMNRRGGAGSQVSGSGVLPSVHTCLVKDLYFSCPAVSHMASVRRSPDGAVTTCVQKEQPIVGCEAEAVKVFSFTLCTSDVFPTLESPRRMTLMPDGWRAAARFLARACACSCSWMALRRAWLRVRCLCCSRWPVRGERDEDCNHLAMASCSYEWPSAAVTGSDMTSRVRGQTNEGGTSALDADVFAIPSGCNRPDSALLHVGGERGAGMALVQTEQGRELASSSAHFLPR